MDTQILTKRQPRHQEWNQLAEAILDVYRGHPDHFTDYLPGKKSPQPSNYAYGKTRSERGTAPLTTAAVIQHLAGKRSAGVYHLDDDGKVWLAEFDVDDHDDENPNWRENARQLFGLMKHAFGVQPIVATGQSGIGVHITVAFSSPVDAWKLRAIKDKLVQIQLPHLGKTEFFPKQDSNGGGYGNLTRLPLWNKSRFVDIESDFETLDPLDALADIEKVDPSLLDDLADELFQGTDELKPPQERKPTARPMPTAMTADDDEILQAIGRSKNAAKVEALLRGEWEGTFRSQSQADYSLLLHLTFYCGHDAARIDRLFRTSGLMRDKWDEPRPGGTYGSTSIDNAIETVTVFWQGNAADLEHDLEHDVEAYTEPTEQLVEIDAWRKEMAAARIESIGKPGLYCDSSPTGAGKSHADAEAMKLASKSLTLLPTHENCREAVKDLADDHGIEAVAYPELTKDSCKNFDEATAARDAGLSTAAAVCSRCEHRYDCDYKRDSERAKQAPHAVACHQRARRFIKLATGKKYIAVHENAEDLLRPTETFSKTDLGTVTDAVAQIRDVISGNACDHSAEQTEMKDFFSSMLNVAESMRQQLSKATTTKAVSMPLAFGSKPKHVEQKLWWAVRKETHSQDKYGKLKKATQPVNAAAMRTLIALATGELNQLVVQVDSVRKKKGGELKTVKRFVATWQTQIPNKPVWFSDATQTAEYLAHLAGRPVEDKTPGGRLARLADVMQIPRDITRGMTVEKVASWLRGILAANPNAKDIGLIGHQHHVVELTSDKSTLLDKRSKAKICRWAYFGQGIDRASNDWQGLDLLIVLGTPRVGDLAIRQRLIRAGQVEAAAADGDWGDRCWEGRTTEGQPETVKARSYQNPAWHAEYERQTHAALIQAVGRARPVLASGVKVVCVTTANIGLPVAAAEATSTISAKVQAAAAAVESERKDSLKDSIKGNLSFKPGVSTKAVAEKLGVSPQRASQLLAEAADVGLVERLPGKRAGWTPAEVAEQDAERAAIQAESAEFEAVVELPAIESVDWPPSRPPWLPAMPERLPEAALPPLELAVPG